MSFFNCTAQVTEATITKGIRVMDRHWPVQAGGGASILPQCCSCIPTLPVSTASPADHIWMANACTEPCFHNEILPWESSLYLPPLLSNITAWITLCCFTDNLHLTTSARTRKFFAMLRRLLCMMGLLHNNALEQCLTNRNNIFLMSKFRINHIKCISGTSSSVYHEP